MQFFPPGVLDENPGLSAALDHWYSSCLLAMQEHPLYPSSSDGSELYRLLFLPTFSRPAVVRLNHVAGTWQATCKSTDGLGGYSPGQISHEGQLTLSPTDVRVFNRLLERADFWRMSSYIPSNGLDGSQVILEGVRNGTYHLVDRWSPRANPFAKLAHFLLRLDRGLTEYVD